MSRTVSNAETRLYDIYVIFLSSQGGGGGGQGALPPPPIEILPMIKVSQKRLLFLQFLLASSPTTEHAYNQARSQKFAMGGAVLGVWGRSPQPPEANGGLGAKPPAAGGWGFGGKAPSRRRHGGLGAEPPALENFAFFLQK